MVLVIIFITLLHIKSFAFIALNILGEETLEDTVKNFAERTFNYKLEFDYVSSVYKSLSVDNIIRVFIR